MRGLEMKKILAASIVLATLSSSLQVASAGTEGKNNNTNVTQKSEESRATKTWLGVSLASVPKVLSKQLGELVPENQGVMVQSVSPNSPASKAGLQAYDILLRFNDQKLYSAQQLAGLVSANKAGEEINLMLVRNGESKETKVTLEGHSVATQAIGNSISRHPFFGFNQQPFPRPLMPMQPLNPLVTKGNNVNVMQQFESVSINKTGDGKVKAEVSYDNNGDKKEFTFEGSYDEVRKQIKDTKELPEDKKNSLLNALQNKPNQMLPNGFMNLPQMPALPAFDDFFNQQQRAPSWFKNAPKL